MKTVIFLFPYFNMHRRFSGLKQTNNDLPQLRITYIKKANNKV